MFHSKLLAVSFRVPFGEKFQAGINTKSVSIVISAAICNRKAFISNGVEADFPCVRDASREFWISICPLVDFLSNGHVNIAANLGEGFSLCQALANLFGDCD